MKNNIQIYILYGADESIVGLDFGEWSVKSAHKTPFCKDDYLSPDIPLFPKLNTVLNNIGIFKAKVYEHPGENPFYIYLRSDSQEISDVINVMNTLRLYKSSQIGTFCPMSFNYIGGSIVNMFSKYEYSSSIKKFDPPVLSFNHEDKTKVIKFFKTTQKGYPDYIKHMLDLFHESFRVGNESISYILRITILEMLINGNLELRFRLSRSVAVLLGRNKEESAEIFGQCKKMYDARSTFLHDGNDNKITKEYSDKALEYSRRVIANLMLIDKKIDEIRPELDSNGYGTNPFNVYL